MAGAGAVTGQAAAPGRAVVRGRAAVHGGAAVAVLAALVAFGLLRDRAGIAAYYTVLLTTFLFWTAQATSWNVLSGFSGYFSFGQGAFVGVGVYTTAVLTGRHGVNFFLTLPVAGALSVVLALAVGAAAFRLRSFRGEIFALLTLAVPFILAAHARINGAIDGGQGIVVPIPSFPERLGQFQDFLYLLNLAVAAAAVASAYAIAHSRFGRALAAVRDAEDVAEGLGVPTYRYKMLAIAVSGLIGGVSGGLFALQIGFVTVEGVFTLTVPLFVIVISVLGGRQHWLGPVLGAAVITMLQDRLSAPGLVSWRLIVLGATLATLVVVAPDGLQARLRIRPRAAAGAGVLVGAVLAAARWGESLDWIAAGMLAAVVVALWPAGRRTTVDRTAAPAVAPPGAAPAGAAPAGADPAGAAPAGAAPATVDGREPGRPGAPGPTAGEPGAVLVECLDVARYFGGVRALDGVTLTLRAGELVGLVGPNGSGKTTLVNLLSGAIQPSRGSIRVAGRAIAGLPAHRVAHAGVLRTYQIPRPFDSMTVRDNVATAVLFGRHPVPLVRARQAADRCLDTVHLGHLGDAYPAQINLHQRQLLEIARALAAEPAVLLLDEALAGLNPAEIDDAVRVIRRIHESGITIVIVEHLLRVVNQLATRIVVVDRGRVLADGEPGPVMRDPAVVSAYLGRRAAAGAGGPET